MPEMMQGTSTFLALLLTLISSWLWMLGGRPHGRIFYRFIAPLFFATVVTVISLLSDFKPVTLYLIPYYLIVTHLGHTKFHERLFECILYGLPSIFFGFTILFPIQMLLCVCAAVIGHFFNQKPAPKVEMLVNFLRIALVGYMVS
jgi:hypothetical protein